MRAVGHGGVGRGGRGQVARAGEGQVRVVYVGEARRDGAGEGDVSPAVENVQKSAADIAGAGEGEVRVAVVGHGQGKVAVKAADPVQGVREVAAVVSVAALLAV